MPRAVRLNILALSLATLAAPGLAEAPRRSAPPGRAPIVRPDPETRPRLRTPTRPAPGRDGQGRALAQGPAGATDFPAFAVVELTALDLTDILPEDEALEELAKFKRVGVDRVLPDGQSLMAPLDGQWLLLEGDEGFVWRAKISTPDAVGLRVHFERFDIPIGAEVVVAGANGEDAHAFTHGGLWDGEPFWSQAVFSRETVIEYYAPLDVTDLPEIEIDRIAHLYSPEVKPQSGADPTELPQGDCLEDVNCWSPNLVARDSVGRYMWQTGGGTGLCSGALLNDLDDNTFAGYFLTANHCLSTQTEANTVNVLWFYQTDACGGAVSSNGSSMGATLLETGLLSDYTLMRLRDDPKNGQGFSAWTTDAVAVNDDIHAIHHPGGSWKRFTSGPATLDPPICTTNRPTSRYWYWDEIIGQTEGGSSGSPLFNGNWEIVGQLFGACLFQTPNCTNQEEWNALGGKFSHAYPEYAEHLEFIAPDDEFEPADTLATAAPLGVGEHDLILVDCFDYYSVEICQTGPIAVSASFNASNLHLELSLLTQGGAVIDSDSSLTGSAAVLGEDLPPGVYVIKLEKTARWGDDYTLNILAGGADNNQNGVPDECECRADLDGNGSVGPEDLAFLLGEWGPDPGMTKQSNLSGDDQVGPLDLAILLGLWGPCP